MRGGRGTFDGIPPDAVMLCIIRVLRSRGSSIPEIEAGRGRGYPAGRGQQALRGRRVWHAREGIDRAVAGCLRLDRRVLGRDRADNSFQTSVTRQLVRLRKMGYIADWNPGRRYRIHRLSRPAGSLEGRIRDGMKGAQGARPGMRDRGPALMRDFVWILRHGHKDGTYKFALARALLDYCNKHGGEARPEIPYRYLASKFFEYYWHQEYRFRMRQTSKTKRQLVVVRAIRDVFGEECGTRFGRIPADKRGEAVKQILDRAFGTERGKTSIVVHRFQNVRGSGGRFYDAYDREKILRLRPGVIGFLCGNYEVLMRSVVMEWAKYLEGINGSLPRLVAKLERGHDGRGPLPGVRRAHLGAGIGECFYCGGAVGPGGAEVDHFIPWSYMFSDDWWNMVISCRACGRGKGNRLPPAGRVADLARRNAEYAGRIGPLGASLVQLGPRAGWEGEIGRRYRLCLEQGFAVWGGR
ncbi:MAG: HNH endonuclease [Nitrosopumilus sp.]|nr:HNH endonuclease [Nitrosopumilus sp.]MDA7957476.1 HNH endonuclease [Nitrosopumilus sp.]